MAIREPSRTLRARFVAALCVLVSLSVCRAEAFGITGAGSAASGTRGWKSFGAVPGAPLKYPPQGMTLVGTDLVFSDHRRDTGSRLFRYRRDTLELVAAAEMPVEATHTGGLAWDGASLWAADFNANRLYRLDLERTFRTGIASVIASYSTGLHGTSALTALRVAGTDYLAISDYGWLPSSRTYIVRVDRIGERMTRPLVELADVSYENGGFAQGLAWDGAFLYEAVNGLPKDSIWIVDVADALVRRDARRVKHLGRFDGPGHGIEDLATDGRSLWTSDESSYEFYRHDDLAMLRANYLRGSRSGPARRGFEVL